MPKDKQNLSGLNPCFNGIWSQAVRPWAEGLRRCVLILVVMEYGLRLCTRPLKRFTPERLNPCCTGIWSQTREETLLLRSKGQVLILIVMEFGS